LVQSGFLASPISFHCDPKRISRIRVCGFVWHASARRCAIFEYYDSIHKKENRKEYSCEQAAEAQFTEITPHAAGICSFVVAAAHGATATAGPNAGSVCRSGILRSPPYQGRCRCAGLASAGLCTLGGSRSGESD